MTNMEALLMAANGMELAEGTTFQPQTNEQAYLAYLVGLITDPSLLPEPDTVEQALMYQLALNGMGGEIPDITDASYLFYNGARLEAFDALLGACKGVTSTLYMFSGCKELEEVDLSDFDTSNVTDMSYMFYGCDVLRTPDFSSWNTSKVTNMANMFYGCRYIENPDVGKWDVSNVTNMSSMFNGCESKEIDVSDWDVSKVTNFSYMFSNCGVKKPDFSKWNTGSAINMVNMFSQSDIEEIDVSSWDVSKVTSMSRMFYYCNGLKKLDLSSWDTSACTNFGSIFSENFSIEELIGFSAMNKAGLSTNIPKGFTSKRHPLRRLTFRTDLEDGKYAIRSAINIPYCSFTRDGMAEMFDTLTDVSSLGLAASYTKITITGNPCVSDSLSLPESSLQSFKTYDEFVDYASKRYCGCDYQNAPIRYEVDGVFVDKVFSDVTEDMFDGESYFNVYFLADTPSIPDSVKLDDATRLLATQKGWTLVE